MRVLRAERSARQLDVDPMFLYIVNGKDPAEMAAVARPASAALALQSMLLGRGLTLRPTSMMGELASVADSCGMGPRVAVLWVSLPDLREYVVELRQSRKRSLQAEVDELKRLRERDLQERAKDRQEIAELRAQRDDDREERAKDRQEIADLKAQREHDQRQREEDQRLMKEQMAKMQAEMAQQRSTESHQ
jgi:hypothetical protein